MVCAHSGTEVPEEDEFVYPGCSRSHRIQIIIELVFNLIWVGHCGCIGTYNCLLPDKGSQRHQAVIYAFWKSWELADEVWLDGESYSCFTPLFFLASTPEETVTSTNFFKSPSSTRRVSLRAAISTLYRSSFLLTIAALRWGLSEPALSIRVRTFHVLVPLRMTRGVQFSLACEKVLCLRSQLAFGTCRIWRRTKTALIKHGSVAKKGKRKVHEVQQSQTAALPRHQEEEETDKSKQAQIDQTYEKL